MGYGLYLRGNDGQVQIDGEFPNYSYFDSGTFTTSAGAYQGVFQQTFTSSVATPPIIALKIGDYLNANIYGVKGLTKSGSNYNGFNLAVLGVNSPYYTIDWVAFTPMGNDEAVSGDYGANVYNSDGDLIWSSDALCMKFIDIHFADDTGSQTVTVNDPTNNYFFIREFNGTTSSTPTVGRTLRGFEQKNATQMEVNNFYYSFTTATSGSIRPNVYLIECNYGEL